LTTYNHVRFVEQALEGAVGQRTRFDYEVVVIDDCSTDGTRELVEDFAAAHPQKVRVVLNPVNENNNRVFAEEWAGCGSEYVALLDGDDYWTSSEKLQLQVDAMEARPEYAVCFHDVMVIAEGMAYVPEGRFSNGFGDGVRIRELTRLPPTNAHREGAISAARRTIDPKELWAGCFVPGCSPLLRRTFLPRLPDAFTPMEFGDWALYLLLGSQGHVLYIDAALGVYRVHPAGIWSGRSREMQHSQIALFLEQMLSLVSSTDEQTIRSEIERHRAAAERERRRSDRHRYLAAALSEDSHSSAEEVLRQHVPADVSVIWVDPVRPSGLRGRLLPFPLPTSGPTKPLAIARSGSRQITWIAPGFAYEFRLVGEAEMELASVTVVADQTAAGPTSLVEVHHGDKTQVDGAYLRATPNPATAAGTHAQTTIEWSTATGQPGCVTVSSYSLDDGMPTDDDAAIQQVEALRARGGAFMLISRPCLSLLALYPGLRHHLAERYRSILDDPAVGLIYDLR
jgi:glycosyltransferase involved in cell wall biosynthesis